MEQIIAQMLRAMHPAQELAHGARVAYYLGHHSHRDNAQYHADEVHRRFFELCDALGYERPALKAGPVKEAAE